MSIFKDLRLDCIKTATFLGMSGCRFDPCPVNQTHILKLINDTNKLPCLAPGNRRTGLAYSFVLINHVTNKVSRTIKVNCKNFSFTNDLS